MSVSSPAESKPAVPHALKESIDYKTTGGSSSLRNKIRVSGLSQAQPLFQTKNNVLLGEWSKLVGSELVFNENGDFITKVHSHIVLKHGRLVDNAAEKQSVLQKALVRATQLENENPMFPESDDDVPMA